jgi:hypothetical protein
MNYHGCNRLILFVIPTALFCLARLAGRAEAALPGSPPPGTGHLTLGTNGSGRLVCSFQTNSLDIGRRYMVWAIPAAGWIFSGWEGTITSTANPLIFTMQSKMLLTANFVPNPFGALHGTYQGLFYPGNAPDAMLGSIDPTNSGFITLTLTTQGRFSGSLLAQGTRLPFSGAFGPDLQAQVVVRRGGRQASPLSLQLDLSAPPLRGLATGDSWESELLAYRAEAGSSNACSGSYTLLVETCVDCVPPESNVPRGDGPAAVTVSPSGSVRMTGTLPDGSPVSQSAIVSPEGLWPLYIPLYGGGGLLIGWMNLNTSVQDEALL